MFTRNDLSGKILHGWLQLTNTQSITWWHGAHCCTVSHLSTICKVFCFQQWNPSFQSCLPVKCWNSSLPQNTLLCPASCSLQRGLDRTLSRAQAAQWSCSNWFLEAACPPFFHSLSIELTFPFLAVTSLTTMLQTELSPPRSELIPSMQITIVCDVTPLCLVCDDVYRGICFLRGWRHTSLQNIGTYIPDYINFQKTYSGPNHTTGTFVFQWKSVVHYGTPVQPQWKKFAWLLIETSLVVLKLVMSHVTTWNLSSEFSITLFNCVIGTDSGPEKMAENCNSSVGPGI
jgi:hypothetical protein